MSLNRRRRTRVVHIGTSGLTVRFNRRDGYERYSIAEYFATPTSRRRLVRVLASRQSGRIELDYWS
jgi:hypothetical protein